MDIEIVKSAYTAYARRAPSAPAYFHQLSSSEQDAWDDALEEVVAPLQYELTEHELEVSALSSSVDELEREVTELKRLLSETQTIVESLSLMVTR